ncbi:hypothetical protein AERO9A_140059 [Aeromonas salmonicida]|nr:hypothetical protein AERO9A_140059 [Aeromonas salmonicida]
MVLGRVLQALLPLSVLRQLMQKKSLIAFFTLKRPLPHLLKLSWGNSTQAAYVLSLHNIKRRGFGLAFSFPL